MGGDEVSWLLSVEMKCTCQSILKRDTRGTYSQQKLNILWFFYEFMAIYIQSGVS